MNRVEIARVTPYRDIALKQAPSLVAVLAIAVASSVGFITYMKFGLGYEFLRSDVLNYWQFSLHPLQPFNIWWMPGYPWILALVRSLTGGLVSPVLLMQCIASASTMVSVAVVYVLAREMGITAPGKWALLFAWFPFVGLTYTASPIADNTAIAFLVLALYAFHREEWTGFALASAAMLLTHKATWFFGIPLSLLAVIVYPHSRVRVLLAWIPVILFLVGGAVYHHDGLWFARWSVDKLLTSRSSLPLFDGILGPFLSGNPVEVIKGGVVATCFFLALAFLISSWKRRLWLVVAAAAGLLLIGAFVNQYEIWVLVRYSKVLVVCLVAWEVSFFRYHPERSHIILNVLLMGSVASNFAFGFYMAKAFYS